MTFTPTPITIKDAASADKSIIAYTDGTSSAFAHPVLDATGAVISPATSGNQTTANSSLAAIATNTTGVATAALQSTGNSSLASLVSTVGATNDAAATTDAGTFSLIALLKRGLSALTSIAANTTGAATAAAQATGNTSLAAILTACQAATPAGTNTIGSVSAAASTTGGTSTYAATGGTGNALLTNAAVAVKASAGSLYGVSLVNTGTAAAYVQLFDLAAASVTLGTTAPKLSFWVPAGGSWEEKFTGEAKVAFAAAIAAAATTTATGSGAPATGVLANIVYK